MIHSIRSAGLSLAALLALGVGAPAQAAIDLVGATNVTFQWTSPAGPEPIDSYLVFVSRNGSTFGTTAQLISPTNTATITGSAGESIAIRVQALDTLGNFGPLSAASETVNLVAAPAPPPPAPAPDPTPPQPDPEPTPAPQPDPEPAPAPAPPPDPTTEGGPIEPESGMTTRPPPPAPEPEPEPTPPQTTTPPVVDPGTRVAFDFDGDARSEVLLRDPATGTLTVLSTDGHIATDSGVASSLSHPVWSVVGAGDFDANGTDDLVLYHGTTGDVALGLAGGVDEFSLRVLGTEGTAWQVAATGDFDADGYADLVWRNDDDGGLIIWHMAADVLVATSTLPGQGLQWQLIGAGDIDGDGTDDLLWRHERGQVNGWRMQDGDIAETRNLGYHAPARWDFVGLGDFNGDGADQPVWQQVGDNRTRIWQMNGFSKRGEALVHLDDRAERVAMIGDYDGDQIADLLTHRDDTGELTIHLTLNERIRSSSVIGETSAEQTAVGVR